MVLSIVKPGVPPIHELQFEVQNDPFRGVNDEFFACSYQVPWHYRMLDRFKRITGLKREGIDHIEIPEYIAYNDEWMSEIDSRITVLKPPSRVILLDKANVEQVDENLRKESGLSFMDALGWANFIWGIHCGVGVAWRSGNEQPHIVMHALPGSKMRGALAWMWGPPWAKNRRNEYRADLMGRPWTKTHLLRCIMHEIGHFKDHYGHGSHSKSREDIMYYAILNIAVLPPRWGLSDRDRQWLKSKYGQPWLSFSN